MKTTDTGTAIETLKSHLDHRRKEFNDSASDEIKTAFEVGVDAVRKSGVLERALQVGDTAPDFILNNQLKEPVRLYDELKKGPVVLTWYRGGWCPYCNITLHYLQEKLPYFEELGASLIALTPELPDNSLNTSEKHNLQFQVLSDVGQGVSKKFGIVYKLTDAVAEIYQNSFDLHAFNGDQSHELPLAATNVIDRQGIIRYAFLDADYRNRAEPEDILQILKEANKD